VAVTNLLRGLLTRKTAFHGQDRLLAVFALDFVSGASNADVNPILHGTLLAA